VKKRLYLIKVNLDDNYGRFPQSVQTPSGPMMPMQLSSEHKTRVVFFLLPVARLEASSLPQCGQNLAHKGAGLWHFPQVSLGMGAPQSEQVSCMNTHLWQIGLERAFSRLGQTVKDQGVFRRQKNIRQYRGLSSAATKGKRRRVSDITRSHALMA
jgi:hypothetical protein